VSHAGHKPHDAATPELRDLSSLGSLPLILGLVAAVAGLALALVTKGDGEEGARRLLLAYLTGWSFFLTITVGSLFFVIMQHLTRAGWSAVVRRTAELLAANMVTMAVLSIPIFVFAGTIYSHWAHPALVDGKADESLIHKAPWLNMPFFLGRLAGYLVVWSALAWWFHGKSLRQDRTGDVQETKTMQGYAGLGVVIFTLTTNWGVFDILMSLNPHWYSTVFGVYVFAGGNLASFATLILIFRFLNAKRIMTESVNREHYHDLGKYLFGWTIFWSYIAFSQFMLYWYGNIPEETAWFDLRGATTNDIALQNNYWCYVSLVLLFCHFVIPFLGLLSRWGKRKLGLLTFWATWMLVFHFVDIYWIIMPENYTGSGDAVVNELPLKALLPAIGCLVGVGGLWLIGLTLVAGKKSLVPIHDPRLEEALSFENY
jgi:hypothetical protein